MIFTQCYKKHSQGQALRGLAEMSRKIYEAFWLAQYLDSRYLDSQYQTEFDLTKDELTPLFSHSWDRKSLNLSSAVTLAQIL